MITTASEPIFSNCLSASSLLYLFPMPGFNLSTNLCRFAFSFLRNLALDFDFRLSCVLSFLLLSESPFRSPETRFYHNNVILITKTETIFRKIKNASILTRTSSGASRTPSLTDEGATSSTEMAGKLLTILISGAGC